MENYNYLSRDENYYWMPVMHYQSNKGWYTELRYNYEELKTVSLYAGKTFSMGGSAKVDLTPMLGYSIGNFKGISLATNAEMEYGKWYASSQLQYSHALNKSGKSFFFSWSEIAWSLTDNFFAGIAGQNTIQENSTDFQPGLLAGFSLGRFTLPVYFFRPFSKNYNVILGVNYEFQLGKKKRASRGNYAVDTK